MSTQVTILGPNLNGAAQQKGQLHVHAAGCADCKHYGPGRKHGGDDAGWTITVERPVDVYNEVYADHVAEGSMEALDATATVADVASYGEMFFAPCVKFGKQASTKPPVEKKAQRRPFTRNSQADVDAETAAMVERDGVKATAAALGMSGMGVRNRVKRHNLRLAEREAEARRQEPISFTKVHRGWYASEDGRYAAVVDGFGFVSQRDRDGNGLLAGITGGEWATVYDAAGRLRVDHQLGENLDWFPTMREAIEYAQQDARRRAR